MRNIFIVIAMIFILSSCQKLKNENVIPESQPNLSELQDQYQNLLISPEDGWYLEYAGSETEGTVSIWMKFYKDRVIMQSDLYNFNDENTSTYRVGGVIRPELIFDTYCVWTVIAERMGGQFQFHIYPQENGTIILKYIFDNKDREFVLRKANSADRDIIVSKIKTSTMLADFEKNATAYFKNLILADITAFWEIDVSAQVVKLTWEDESQNIVSKELKYSNLSNGIRFAEPWKVGNILVNELIFGSVTDSELEITKAGNAGVGRIESAHVPAFPYKNAAERYIFSNSFKTNEDPVRFLGYTVDENAVSPALKPYYDAVMNALPSFWRIQVYNFNPTSAPRNSIAFVGKNDANSNVWYYFYYDLQQINSSFIIPTYEDSNIAGGTIIDHPDVKAFLNAIYPPEGVTIVPLSGQNLRVVSSVNSQLYMELRVSTPSSIWSN